MRIFFILIELSILSLCAWTLSYHFVLINTFSARTLLFIFPILEIGLLVLFWKRWLAYFRNFRKSDKFGFIGVLVVALLSGIFTLTNLRPDMDDFSFLHRAIWQSLHLDLPIANYDLSLNRADLPIISLTHLLTSYEMFVAFAAKILPVKPVFLYQNLLGSLAGMLIIIVSGLIFHQLGVKKRILIWACLAFFAFLLIDQNLHRSFGSFIIFRLWQGKTILVGIFLGITFLYALKIHLHKGYDILDYLILFMLGVCSVGLSGSGIFLYPLMVLALCFALLLADGLSKRSFIKAVLNGCMALYPLLIAFAIKVGLIPLPQDKSVWSAQQGWPADWYNNLLLVFQSGETILRNAILLFILPLLTLRKNRALFLIVYAGTLFILYTNSWSGPLMIKQVYPAAYWRLAYLYLIPIHAGLLVLLLTQVNFKSLRSIARVAVFLLLVAFILHIGVKHDTKVSRFVLKKPWEYKFPRMDQKVSVNTMGYLRHRNALLPYNVAVVAGLHDTSILLEANRKSQTIHIFGCINQREEGVRRTRAQAYTERCESNREQIEAFQISLSRGVNAVLIKNCTPEKKAATESMLRNNSKLWKKKLEIEGYTLYLKNVEISRLDPRIPNKLKN